MNLIADILMISGALGAGFYCLILARRLTRFNSLEKGVGGAVAVLSSQVDELNQSLVSARALSETSRKSLDDLTQRAEDVAGRLELIMASFHDFPNVEDRIRCDRSTEISQAPESDVPVFVRHGKAGLPQ